jgi:serine/threonine protein kinase
MDFKYDFSKELAYLRSCGWFMQRFKVEDADIKLLGKGSFGTVFSVIEKHSERKKALKLMLTDNLKQFEELTREINILKVLEHSNIIKIYEDFCHRFEVSRPGGLTEEFAILYTMDIASESLEKRIRERKKLSMDEIKKVAVEMLSALLEAHKKKIVHCDIKPQNILIYPSPNNDSGSSYQVYNVNLIPSNTYVLSDWGCGANIASSRSNLTVVKDGMGFTQNFSSPEILKYFEDSRVEEYELKKYDFYKADIYSLGLVLLYCCGVTKDKLKRINHSSEENYKEILIEILNSCDEPIMETYFRKCLEDMLQYESSNRKGAEELLNVFGGGCRIDLLDTEFIRIEPEESEFIRIESEEKKFNIIVIGPPFVGKSSILKLLEKKENRKDGVKSEYATYVKKNVTLIVWDSNAQVWNFPLLKKNLTRIHLCLLVISDQVSVEESIRYFQLLDDLDFNNRYLIQNKKDLNLDLDLQPLEYYIQNGKTKGPLKCSAETEEGIWDVFDIAVDDLLASNVNKTESASKIISLKNSVQNNTEEQYFIYKYC